MLRTITTQFEPIDTWPGEPTRRTLRAPFKSTWQATCQLLERELRFLGVRSIVIEQFLERWQIRNDGFPRADARPRLPGVIISFQSNNGPLRYPCDRFDDWQDNVRAIALALEALRKVDRYGVTKRGEQYRGWAALPPPATSDTDFATDWAAVNFLNKLLGIVISIDNSRDTIEAAIRAAEKATHPDRGGNPDDFKKVQSARKLLLS